MKITTKTVSALHKIFPFKEPKEYIFSSDDSVLKNEAFSFQIAYYGHEHGKVRVEVIASSDDKVNIYRVGLVQSNLPAYEKYDDNYLSVDPGLYPDVLYPMINGESLNVESGKWHSLWVEVKPNINKDGGCRCITVDFLDEDDSIVNSTEVRFLVLNEALPKQELIHTEWFHSDCICHYYRVEPMSNKFWSLIEAYIKMASDHGINMILTPIFTPPLDTEVGGERLTIQLVDVHIKNGRYSFYFEKLKRWIDICIKNGIEYFEMSHLFTQWGAKSAPKIIAIRNGKQEQIFGWDTNLLDPSYKDFLSKFLPELVQQLKLWNILNHCYFHISDEPDTNNIDSYKAAKQMVEQYLEDNIIIDALSSIQLYKKEIVSKPIPSNDHIEPFINAGIENLWTYYCCAQCIDVSNRFMAMPSSRNRIIGVQIYKYDIEGFLHWGYNFWNTQFSKEAIDPYKITDAGGAFASGDSFLVYPSENGPVPSIRLKVLAQAMYDIRALKLLEAYTTKDYVLEILESSLEQPITFKKYPKNDEYLVKIRKYINAEIERQKGVN